MTAAQEGYLEPDEEPVEPPWAPPLREFRPMVVAGLQRPILKLMTDGKPYSQRDIAARYDVAHQHVAWIELFLLHDKGLVTLHSMVPGDWGRSTEAYVITDEGRAYAETIGEGELDWPPADPLGRRGDDAAR